MRGREADGHYIRELVANDDFFVTMVAHPKQSMFVALDTSAGSGDVMGYDDALLYQSEMMDVVTDHLPNQLAVLTNMAHEDNGGGGLVYYDGSLRPPTTPMALLMQMGTVLPGVGAGTSDDPINLDLTKRSVFHRITQRFNSDLAGIPTVWLSPKTVKAMTDNDVMTRYLGEQDRLIEEWQCPFPDGGFAAFATPVMAVNPVEGNDGMRLFTTYRAVWWTPGPQPGLMRIVMIGTTYGMDGELIDPAMPYTFHHSFVEFGRVIESKRAYEGLMFALVMRELATGDSSLHSVGASSREARRTAKKHLSDRENPEDVHVVYFGGERTQVKGRDCSRDSSGTVRRHIVRAHWRRQPYGPREAGKWRWKRIESHERGGGPRDDRERVYRKRGA